jgi:hypothetical protein
VITILLDEMFSQVSARIARRAGVDVISVHELRLEGVEDRNILMIAAQDGRCIVTDNYRHFAPLTLQFQEQGLPHGGVLLVPSWVGHDAFAPLARALVRFARDNPDGLQPYELRWLPLATD